jgi:hypothetical protein
MRAGKAAGVSATPVDGVPATPEGAKPRAIDRRCRATPGHVQPRLPQADATSGDTRPHSATVRSRLTSEKSLVRTQVRPRVSAGQPGIRRFRPRSAATRPAPTARTAADHAHPARPAPTRRGLPHPSGSSRIATAPSCRCPPTPTPRSPGWPPAVRTAGDGTRPPPDQDQRRRRQRRPLRQRTP